MIPYARGIALAACYLLGSIPFAYLLVRLAGRGDVRAVGSGNVGATNSLRAAGWKVAALVLVLDVTKGAVAVLLMRQATANPAWAAAAGVAAIAGHCFPVWLRFRGGKGVATLIGAWLLVAPAALGVAGVVWALTFAASRVVALASLLAAAALPIAASIIMRPSGAQLACLAAASLIVIGRHRDNLSRLVRGEEPRMTGKGRR